MKRQRRWVGLILVLAAVAGLAVLGTRASLARFRAPETVIPTARVKRGDLILTVHTRGELGPARSSILMAPSGVGGQLEIVSIAKTGTKVKVGEIMVQFNPSDQQYKFEQARSQLREAEQNIIKAKADAAVQSAQDKVALLKAKFDVRRAELDVSKNELLSAIDAKKNNLALEEARRRLTQLEHDVQSRSASNAATIAVQEEKRNKARLDMQQAQQAIEKMDVRAPWDGLVAVRPNWMAYGGIVFSGMSLPDFSAGDQVWPGVPVAEIMDVTEMEIQAKVSEADRAMVNVGDPVEVRVSALPGEVLHGKLKTVAGLAARQFFFGDAMRKFDVSVAIDNPSADLRSGLSADLAIGAGQAKNVLYLPREALFEKDGKRVAYVKTGGAYLPQEVKVSQQTEAFVAVEGLKEGAEVALVNPEKPRVASSAQPVGPPAPTGGGAR